MIDNGKDYVEELKESLRLEISKEERALHEKLERLRAYRADSLSDFEDDYLDAQMRAAAREFDASVAPLRAELHQIARAQAAIRACEPMTLSIPTPPPA